MTRRQPPRKYTFRIQAYVDRQIVDGLKVLVLNGAMSESAHVRTALLGYLRAYGLAMPQPQPLNNGHQKELEHHGQS